MALVRKKRIGKEGRALAEDTTSANLFADDLVKLLGYVRAGEGTKADVLRTLVSEAIERREEGKEVARHGEKRVKKLHLEAISEGTKTLEDKVDELLSIGRKGGVALERILNLCGDNFGLAFELLILVEGIFSMVTNDVTKPRLTEKVKAGGRSVEETLATMREKFEGRAVEKVGKVRKEVRAGAGADRAA